MQTSISFSSRDCYLDLFSLFPVEQRIQSFSGFLKTLQPNFKKAQTHKKSKYVDPENINV